MGILGAGSRLPAALQAHEHDDVHFAFPGIGQKAKSDDALHLMSCYRTVIIHFSMIPSFDIK